MGFDANTPPTSLGGGGTIDNGGSLSLMKGNRIELTKGNPGLDNLLVGLGWDVNATGGADYDLDAEVFLLDGENNLIELVYYNHLKSAEGSIQHHGDNLTGLGDGDDEMISIQLSKVPQNVQRIVFTVTIYDAVNRRQNFGQVNNAYIRVVDNSTNQEVCRYDLSEDYSMSTAVVAGEVYRRGSDWKFGALGVGTSEDLNGLADYLKTH